MVPVNPPGLCLCWELGVRHVLPTRTGMAANQFCSAPLLSSCKGGVDAPVSWRSSLCLLLWFSEPG